MIIPLLSSICSQAFPKSIERMKTLIVTAIDISHLSPQVSLKKHRVSPKQASFCLHIIQAGPLGSAHPRGTEGWSWTRDALGDHLQDTKGSLSVLLPLHGLTSQSSAYIWRAFACFQKNRMISNHLFVNRGHN